MGMSRSRTAARGVAGCLLLGLGVLLGLGCGGSSAYHPSLAKDRSQCTLELSLPNMACSDACPVKVRRAIGSVAGVRSVDVDYEARTATVSAVYPACSGAGYDQMVSNLQNMGYP